MGSCHMIASRPTQLLHPGHSPLQSCLYTRGQECLWFHWPNMTTNMADGQNISARQNVKFLLPSVSRTRWIHHLNFYWWPLSPECKVRGNPKRVVSRTRREGNSSNWGKMFLWSYLLTFEKMFLTSLRVSGAGSVGKVAGVMLYHFILQYDQCGLLHGSCAYLLRSCPWQNQSCPANRYDPLWSDSFWNQWIYYTEHRWGKCNGMVEGCV